MSVKAIKKALEGVTPGPWFEGDKWVFVSPRSGLMNEALENVLRNDEAQANTRYIAAVNPAAISELLSTLESLQRENEELRQRLDVGPYGEDAIDVAESAADHLRQRAEAAEAEVKRLREALGAVLAAHDIKSVKGKLLVDVIASATERARQALASTGGEHNAE